MRRNSCLIHQVIPLWNVTATSCSYFPGKFKFPVDCFKYSVTEEICSCCRWKLNGEEVLEVNCILQKGRLGVLSPLG